MSNKYNEKQRDSDCRAPVLPSPDAVSDPRKNTRFCVNPTRFSLFFERRRGWGRRFFVNEGEHAGGREAARGLRRVYLLGCNMLGSSGLHGG